MVNQDVYATVFHTEVTRLALWTSTVLWPDILRRLVFVFSLLLSIYDASQVRQSEIAMHPCQLFVV